ncbi:MAG: class I SAM-dependent methyltransferase [Planctomycetota bacterium]|jgi:demethylmenaquinone methyltransferase/2-methoxy-6-polyprenyl-1,4-benzoquinol methylase
MKKQSYKWWYDHIESKFYDLLIKAIALPLGGEARLRREILEPVSFEPGEKILEMCCGTGGATIYISEKAGAACEIVAVDLSSGQLQRARGKKYSCPTEFVEGDVTGTAFDSNSFDKVFITHAIHEMYREDRLKTLKEARRVLKQNGQVVVLEIDDPPSLWVRLLFGFIAFYWLPGNFETPTRRDMFKRGLDNEVRESGFVDVQKYSIRRGVLQTVTGVKGQSQ